MIPGPIDCSNTLKTLSASTPSYKILQEIYPKLYLQNCRHYDMQC